MVVAVLLHNGLAPDHAAEPGEEDGTDDEADPKLSDGIVAAHQISRRSGGGCKSGAAAHGWDGGGSGVPAAGRSPRQMKTTTVTGVRRVANCSLVSSLS